MIAKAHKKAQVKPAQNLPKIGAFTAVLSPNCPVCADLCVPVPARYKNPDHRRNFATRGNVCDKKLAVPAFESIPSKPSIIEELLAHQTPRSIGGETVVKGLPQRLETVSDIFCLNSLCNCLALYPDGENKIPHHHTHSSSLELLTKWRVQRHFRIVG